MSKTVATPSAEVEAIRTKARPIIDLTKGGDWMRGRGETYLPKFEMESQEAYDARRKSTWLFDGVGKTIEDMSGKVFDRPIDLPDASTTVEDWAKDIDLTGRDLNQFAKQLFSDGQRAGISFVMVDAPRREGEVTKAQAKAQNLRPYMTVVTIDQVVGWKWEAINSAPTLTQFRIVESVQEPDPDNEFEDKAVEQVRVLDRVGDVVSVRIFRKSKDEKWKLHEEYPTDLKRIMVAPFAPEGEGFMQACPVHDRLAEINLAHWRIQSDKASCLHKALAPLLFIKGFELEGDQAVSANAGFNANSEHSDLKWVEISGSGISEARTELKDLEFQMQAMGLQLIISKTGNNTATGDTIDEGKINSRLSMWADALKDCLENAFAMMVEIAGESDEVTVDVNKDYAANALSHLDMDVLNKMFLAGVISKETYINEAKRRNVLAEDVDPEQEIANAEEVLDEPSGEE